MLILLDQDGVLADFERGFRDAWNMRYADLMPALAPADRKSFHLREDYPARLYDAVRSIYEAPGFYRDLPPMPDAREGVRGLLEEGHDVRVCTSPLTFWRNCVPEKYEWVERHLGADFLPRLIVTKDKTLVRGHVLVDDKPRVDGAEMPLWHHVIFDAPYNASVTGPRMTWRNWRETMARVEHQMTAAPRAASADTRPKNSALSDRAADEGR